MKNNFSFLKKIDLISLELKADLKKIFYEEQINKLNFEKIKKINFKKCKLDNINYLFFFPNLSKLNFKRCIFIEMPSHFSINFNKTKSVIFNNCNLNNDNVNYLMNEFQNLQNLEIIDFSINNITNFNFKPNSPFKKLHSLILRKNKISKINIFNEEILKKYYPKLDFIDIVSNNLCNFDESDFNNFMNLKENMRIILFGKNLFLHNKPIVLKKYLKFLIKSFSNSTANIKSLDLSHLFYKFKTDEKLSLKNIRLNLNIQITIRKLDLSFNSLNDADLFDLFKENQGLVNLNEIVLKNNNFTGNILNLFLKINSQYLFEYLKSIDLSENKLEICSLKILRKMIDDNKNLHYINLKDNPLIEDLFSINKATPENKILVKEYFDYIEDIKKNKKRELPIKYYE